MPDALDNSDIVPPAGNDQDSKRSYLPLNGLPPVPTDGIQSKGPIWMLLWWFLLMLEVFIYSSYSVLAHLCLVNGSLPFRASSVVLCTEVTKILMSIVMLWPELHRGDVKLPPLSSCLAFMVPAVLYSVNNNLSVHMQVHMDPTTYQILGNMKVVTTAVLYRFIIQRKLMMMQWVSLGLLAAAGMFDSYGGLQSKGGNWFGEIHVTVTGLAMMGVYCWISGFAGVYTEYILKKNYQTSLHLQNILLYIFGIVCNGGVWIVQEVYLSAESRGKISSLFEGFTHYTWMIVITQAMNGLIMSAIMKHSSNITRLFIISCAMLVTTVLSVVIFKLALSVYYILAFVMVIVALYMYYR